MILVKKGTSIFLIVISLFSLMCLSGNRQYALATDSSWEVKQYIDDFGDVIVGSDSFLTTNFSGTFSNTATSSDSFDGVMYIEKKDSEDYVVSFRLIEYGNHVATFSASDPLTLKVKVNNDIYDFMLTGQTPNGDLYLGSGDHNTDGDWLFEKLYSNNDVRCIIKIGNSQYNFTIESENMPDIADKHGFSLPVICELPVNGDAFTISLETLLSNLNIITSKIEELSPLRFGNLESSGNAHAIQVYHNADRIGFYLVATNAIGKVVSITAFFTGEAKGFQFDPMVIAAYMSVDMSQSYDEIKEIWNNVHVMSLFYGAGEVINNGILYTSLGEVDGYFSYAAYPAVRKTY